MNLVEINSERLTELCEQYNVKELYIFGSILTDKFNDLSDIDMLIQFSQIDVLEYFDNYMDLKEALENLFQRDVDLIENQAIRNPIFRQVIEREKKIVYERKSA
ncbi:MAG: nucleotidyltransferase domain-containing protein [Paludibacter sp.]